MSGEGILGIKNWTENWKTAHCFSQFIRNDVSRLRLAKKIGSPKLTQPNEVSLELFWKGIRDYLNQKGQNIRANEKYFQKFVNIYESLSPNLQSKVREFDYRGRKLRIEQDWNYNPNYNSGISVDKFGNNLANTEIDIVLETPQCLFIGEAKAEATLDGSGNLVLVHQLIRQYVMAWILIVLTESNKKVVPFMVGANAEQVQVQFMLSQGWLHEKNILSWNQIDAIAKGIENPLC